jgi:hypothetical protein
MRAPFLPAFAAALPLSTFAAHRCHRRCFDQKKKKKKKVAVVFERCEKRGSALVELEAPKTSLPLQPPLLIQMLGRTLKGTAGCRPQQHRSHSQPHSQRHLDHRCMV